LKKTRHAVIEVINLTPGTFILRLDRKDFEFTAGQYVILRNPDHKEGREYSIYSGTEDNYLDFLIRDIPAGRFSNYLRNLTPGSELDVEGPKGFFIPDQRTINGTSSVFIATGTGISPFHSYIKSYADLNYTLIHGVKYASESCGAEAFDADKHIICSSQDSAGNYMGRVTDYLRKSGIDKEAVYYLCGNAAMIDDASTLLENSGIKPENIRSEVYF
jgi:ferredoxin-NADP reductase